MVKSTMTETVPSSGRGGTAAAMAQNEQTACVCLSVCCSATTAEQRITQTTPSDNPGTLVF